MHKMIQEIIRFKIKDLRLKNSRHPGKPQFGAHPGSLNDSGQVEDALGTRMTLRQAILNVDGIAIIAEIKFASPSAGDLGKPKDLLKRIKEYEDAKVDAISIVTEKQHFRGDPSFVSKAKKYINLPILMKDFIFDKSQIYEAKKLGADALLLIARIVDAEKLKEFVKLCQYEGIEPVVEVFDNKDLKKAITTNTRIIAVNARDLDTFEIDVEKACKLIKEIPDRFIKLGFSAVKSTKEDEMYKKAGAKGVLVGTSLMRAKNVKEFIIHLRGGRMDSSDGVSNTLKVKICGIRTLEAAKVAVENGADFLGFNFVPSSKRYISPEKAGKIIKVLRIKYHVLSTKLVGVFQNQAIDGVNRIAKMLNLDFVQLHGDEDKDYLKQIKKPIIKRLKIKDLRLKNQKYILLDREIQGSGAMVDLKKAAEIAKKYPIIFAGGLNPENVEQVIQKVKPVMVDVASGIETNGVQDMKKIREFIKNAKGANL